MFFLFALLKYGAILRCRAVTYHLYAPLRRLVLLVFEQRDEQTGVKALPCVHVLRLVKLSLLNGSGEDYGHLLRQGSALLVFEQRDEQTDVKALPCGHAL